MVLFHGNALRVPHLQTGEQDVQGRLVFLIFLPHLGGGQHLHHHGKVLFIFWGFVHEIEDEGLEQRRFRLGPERVAALRSGRGGALDEGFDESKHVFVIPHIGQGIVAEGGVGAEKVEHPHLIAIGFQSPSGFPQDLGFRVADDQGAVPAVEGVGNGIGAAFAGAAAPNYQHVGIAFVLVAIQPHLKVLGQDEVFLRVLLIPVPLGDLEHIAPLGGAVFRPTAAVLPAGGHRQRHDPIPHGKEQQAPGGILRPVDGKRIVHGCGELPQQVHEVHPGAPASGHQKGSPPNDGQRQQPHPPWILPCSYTVEGAPTPSCF